ncbi:hypothetical protein PVAND_009997 [Polypedilum vanderplanki]|uniref:NADH dehydrogenase [ubiquinone] 1 alpha subcomplex subunit 7 n=1 Tax=Polypedilum vanderplanki TaxID=319348 RepID=A0A9J6CEF8_POLVA|nr:hypothetical protein PVAND_009997 [Polypedilum vanderplanki]
MPPKIYHRDISPFLQRIRAFLLGRNPTNALRFEDMLSPRTQSPPKLPDGVSHKLSANYYLGRDPRREVAPPANLMQKQIGEGAPKSSKLPVPGTQFDWSSHSRFYTNN